MLEENREKFKKIGNKTGEIFSKTGLTPNQYTLASIFFAIISLYFLLTPIAIKIIQPLNKNITFALLFFLASAFLDFIDGAVARFLKMETKKGAYLDTISDRYVEGIILFGFLFLPLPHVIMPSAAWIFLAFFGSLMTTYAKAAAKEKELVQAELKKGLVGRGERMILIALSLILGIFNISWMIYPMIILAIFSNITALQRLHLAFSGQR